MSDGTNRTYGSSNIDSAADLVQADVVLVVTTQCEEGSRSGWHAVLIDIERSTSLSNAGETMRRSRLGVAGQARAVLVRSAKPAAAKASLLMVQNGNICIGAFAQEIAMEVDSPKRDTLRCKLAL